MYEHIYIFDVKAALKKDKISHLETSIKLETSGIVIELNPKVLELPFVNFIDKTLGNQLDPYGTNTFIRFDPPSKRLIYFIYAENIDSVIFSKKYKSSHVSNGSIFFIDNSNHYNFWNQCLIYEDEEEIIFCNKNNLKDFSFQKLIINTNSYFILIDGVIEGIGINLKIFYKERWNKYDFDFIKNYLWLVSNKCWFSRDEEDNIKEVNSLLKDYGGGVFSDDIDRLLEDFKL